MRHMKIDTRVPVPEVKIGRNGYPFADLRPGESFFVPQISGVNIHYWRKKTGYRYTTRKCVESGRVGIRIWRTA